MTKKKQFVAYYRVSTDRQGESGLGLEAQKAAVGGFIGPGSLLGQFQEVESGKRHTNRPQLAAALDHCRKHHATLVIAKLDRLARERRRVPGSRYAVCKQANHSHPRCRGRA
jgi:DNA invertase Pin-like site-specific DNA recombinase